MEQIPGRCKSCQTACKPGSVRPLRGRDGHSSGARLTARLARPTRAAGRECPRVGCTGRPARLAGRPYSVLLPVGFTLPPSLPRPRCAAVCFLLHYPWGRPRRPLAGTVFPWSPDFPPRPKPQRPSGRLAREDMRCAACRVKLAVVPKRDGLSNRDRPQGQAVLECRALVPE